MAIEIVDRPQPYRPTGGSRPKYAEYHAALVDTLTTHRAIRCSQLTRTGVISIHQYFKMHHPTLRVVSRRLPDGFYLWAELRNTNGAVEG